MTKYKNEQGAALILTMFIITILLLFTSAQLFQVTNTRKQVNTMEKSIMAQHMAEMGVDYYRALLDSIEEGADDFESLEDFAKELPTDKITRSIDSNINNGNRSYEVTITEPYQYESDIVTIHFTSKGKAYGVEKTIKSTITIKPE